MTVDETKGEMAGASGVDEKAVEEALKTIRFTDIPHEGRSFPEKSSVPTPESLSQQPSTSARAPLQPFTIAHEIKRPPAIDVKGAAALVPASIVMPHMSVFDDGPQSAPQMPPAVPSAVEPSAPSAPTPLVQQNMPAAGGDMKQDFARIIEETKIPERRSLPNAPRQTPQPETTLVRAGLPQTSAPVQEVQLVTPEGRSAPILSKTPPTPLQKNIVGEAVSAPKKPPQGVEGAIITPTVPPMEKRPIVPSLHTLKDDLYDLVRVRKMSLIHAATLETERKKKSADVGGAATATKTKRRVRLFRLFLAMSIFLALGGAALFAVFIVQTERTTTAPANFGTALIFAEQTLGFPLSPALSPREVRQQLASSRFQGNLTLGAVLRIVPTILSEAGERPATAIEFMKASASEVPDELLRGLANDFFFGVHTVDENVPFIILPISSYENAFAAMLSWEPLLNEGLFPLFPRVHYERVDEQGFPTLVRFEDMIIKNYDVRALRDAEGEIRMLYSFPSHNILIIAESPHSFIEALARLRAERRL